MNDITLLDGGLGQELLRRSGDAPTHMWSTRLMIDHPDLVRAVHADFFAAGAQIATANTYALHRDRLQGTPYEDSLDALYAAALTAAETARADHGSGRIAGALGPLNGSYRPDAHPDLATARPLYAECAERMAGRVDLVICETVASLTHARAALQGAQAAGVPVWLAITVDDEDGTRLRSGEAVADVVEIARSEGAEAVLANCSVPESMPAALAALTASHLPTGAYANAFTRITPEFRRAGASVDALQAREDLGPERYAEHAMSWVAQGARIVGGCCETGPDHIAAIAQHLAARRVAAVS
ncbi:homocysteine S-methyltransferase family protein [Roseovarius sp. D22-M7]|uniref:homocysteine S-methyltransferase family protein n=1 Tax=Roseovarius sp. D22-M7 TaxID=3127116 RepID=UPI0030104F6F